MNWKRVADSLEQSAEDRQNNASMALAKQKLDDAARMAESAHVLKELAYAIRLGLEREK